MSASTKPARDALIHGVYGGDITKRPPDAVFRPERLFCAPDPNSRDWVIEDISCVSLINEDLIAEAYAHDRRKTARKIRQQRRKLRRINAEFGHGPGEGVPEAILRTKIMLRGGGASG